VKPVHVCVTVFNRYDLLRKLVESLRMSHVVPVSLIVIDRGHDLVSLNKALDGGIRCGTSIIQVNLPGNCLAAAWNWFITHVPEERVIASDDIIFFPETLSEFRNTPGDFVGVEDDKGSSHFACFLIRDSCVEKIGLFDESISPNYMYFEDCDYGHRMAMADIPLLGIRHLFHAKDQSLAVRTNEQLDEHNRMFLIARDNFVKKWGRMPEPGKW